MKYLNTRKKRFYNDFINIANIVDPIGNKAIFQNYFSENGWIFIEKNWLPKEYYVFCSYCALQDGYNEWFNLVYGRIQRICSEIESIRIFEIDLQLQVRLSKIEIDDTEFGYPSKTWSQNHYFSLQKFKKTT